MNELVLVSQAASPDPATWLFENWKLAAALVALIANAVALLLQQRTIAKDLKALGDSVAMIRASLFGSPQERGWLAKVESKLEKVESKLERLVEWKGDAERLHQDHGQRIRSLENSCLAAGHFREE